VARSGDVRASDLLDSEGCHALDHRGTLAGVFAVQATMFPQAETLAFHRARCEPTSV